MNALPEFVEPELPTLLQTPPSGPGWAHEIKVDGYRLQLRTVGSEATLRSRNGLDWSAKFPEIALAGAALGDGIFDGEVAALDDAGASDFGALQAAISDAKTSGLVFFVFDQMFCGAEDLRPVPLAERKARLRTSLAGGAHNIRYVEHVMTSGEAALQSACRLNLEGVVSKRLSDPYRSGRSRSWVKAKCRLGHEVVIGGWTTTGDGFRSLLAGVHRNGKLVYIGRIGTGFGRDVVARILPQLQALEADVSPFDGPVRSEPAGAVHWSHPDLVAEISYAGYTRDGLVRQASFKGLREDKPAAQVVDETAA